MEHFDVHRPHSDENISFLFHISMWWRIFYGSIRILLGFTLLKLVGSSFTDILTSLMSYEVTEDPKDALFQIFYSFFQNHSFTVTYFLAGYLLFWGILDVTLSLLLLKHKLWAFHVSMVLIALFILYEIYRFFHTHSLVLLGVIIIDLIILYLIHDEYRVLIKKRMMRATLNTSKPFDPLPRQS